MKVKAKSGARCPMEGEPRRYILDNKAVDVPDTAYYRRLVNDGSIVVVSPSKQKTLSAEKDK